MINVLFGHIVGIYFTINNTPKLSCKWISNMRYIGIIFKEKMDLVIVTVEYILCGIGIQINSYVHMGLPIWVISSKCKCYLNVY